MNNKQVRRRCATKPSRSSTDFPFNPPLPASYFLQRLCCTQCSVLHCWTQPRTATYHEENGKPRINESLSPAQRWAREGWNGRTSTKPLDPKGTPHADARRMRNVGVLVGQWLLVSHRLHLSHLSVQSERLCIYAEGSTPQPPPPSSEVKWLLISCDLHSVLDFWANLSPHYTSTHLEGYHYPCVLNLSFFLSSPPFGFPEYQPWSDCLSSATSFCWAHIHGLILRAPSQTGVLCTHAQWP